VNTKEGNNLNKKQNWQNKTHQQFAKNIFIDNNLDCVHKRDARASRGTLNDLAGTLVLLL
jgi:hypothetical protein